MTPQGSRSVRATCQTDALKIPPKMASFCCGCVRVLLLLCVLFYTFSNESVGVL